MPPETTTRGRPGEYMENGPLRVWRAPEGGLLHLAAPIYGGGKRTICGRWVGNWKLQPPWVWSGFAGLGQCRACTNSERLPARDDPRGERDTNA